MAPIIAKMLNARTTSIKVNPREVWQPSEPLIRDFLF
jgi:hypothetical protein